MLNLEKFSDFFVSKHHIWIWDLFESITSGRYGTILDTQRSSQKHGKLSNLCQLLETEM